MSSWFAFAMVPLLWLPGHFALRLAGVPRVARPHWSPVEKLFVEVALSALLLLWIGVTLACLGLFSDVALAACAAVPTVGLAVVLRRTKRSLFLTPSWRPDSVLVAVIVLVAAGYQLYQPAFEQIVGGRDPVTYMVSGVHLARAGSWVSYDEVVAGIPAEHREAFLGPDRRQRVGHWGSRLIGWYLMDPETARVVPQGLPLYPTTIGLGYLVAGIGGAVNATKVLAVLSVVALFLLGRRFLGTEVGLTAAAFLLVSPAQVWFSRFANAETAAQVLVLVGLYGLLMYRRAGGWAFALMAGASFGLALQTHIFMIWLGLPLASILVADLLKARVDREALLAFWLPLGLLGAQALLVYFTIATAYLWGVYLVVRQSAWAIVPAIPVIAAAMFAIGYWGRRRAARSSPNPGDDPASARGARSAATARRSQDEAGGNRDAAAAAVGERWMRLTLAFMVVAGAVYGYWFRSLVTNAWSADAVPRLALAVGIGVLGFAVAGVVALLADQRRGDATLCVIAVTLGIIVPVLYDPKIIRRAMWSLRRYQSFLPLVFLFAAVPIWFHQLEAATRTGRQRWLKPLSLLVAVFLLVPLATQGVRYRGFKQPGDAIALVDQIAGTLEEDAVLVFEARSGWGALDLAPALAYWKGFDVVWLRNKGTDGPALRDFVRRQTQSGRPVYFFTQGFNYYVPEPRVVPHRRWWFERRQLEETLGVLPERVLDSRMPLSSYRVVPTGRNGPLDGGLDVGNWDDIYVGEALPWEQVNEQLTARWTKPTGSFFWLPGLAAGAREIIVHAGTIENSGAFERTLTASLNGVVLGEIPLRQEWTDYVFAIPSDWRPAAAAPRLELSTQPLQPDVVNGNGDTRYLGVFVNAILWR